MENGVSSKSTWACVELEEALEAKWGEEAADTWHLDARNMYELLTDLRDNPWVSRAAAQKMLERLQDWAERNGRCPECWGANLVGVPIKHTDPTLGVNTVCRDCEQVVD